MEAEVGPNSGWVGFAVKGALTGKSLLVLSTGRGSLWEGRSLQGPGGPQLLMSMHGSDQESVVTCGHRGAPKLFASTHVIQKPKTTVSL